MTAPSLIRVHERQLDSGARELSVVCSCASVGRLLAAWEDREAAVAELLAEHRQRAAICPHRRSWDHDAADRARAAAGGSRR